MKIYYINQPYLSNIEVKKSKFISYLVDYKEFDTTIKLLKQQHPKARHIIYAYRYLNEYNQIVENSSDDGEPKGVAGRPTLTVMQGHKLINCAVITIRYFGGIKLGMGGMVRAYSDSANEVISFSSLIEYVEYCYENIEIEYNQLSIVEYECKKLDIIIDKKIFDIKVTLGLKGIKENLNIALDKITKL